MTSRWGDVPTMLRSPDTCAALATAIVPAARIGEAGNGAAVTSATYVYAVPDTLNSAGGGPGVAIAPACA
jgi:hypothetical protein